jgi:hypothetical protein
MQMTSGVMTMRRWLNDMSSLFIPTLLILNLAGVALAISFLSRHHSGALGRGVYVCIFLVGSIITSMLAYLAIWYFDYKLALSPCVVAPLLGTFSAALIIGIFYKLR